ncbi:MAG: hypothetical protein COS89_04055 [Deltaproteobacteria bacterium CG07_land_8_20_14_0_80_38_7]|nr:MAG: hypothetical protein COS89_04055 [Deltaproteobacteria bacterium CG07_land_8_20_14_0_80_38_7]
MKKLRVFWLIILTSVVFISCNNLTSYSKEGLVREKVKIPAPMEIVQEVAGKGFVKEDRTVLDVKLDLNKNFQDRKIIYTGEVSIEVKSCKDSISKIDDIVKRSGGFIADSKIWEQEKDRKAAELVIKVPSKNYDEVLVDLSTIGKVKSEQSNSNDITEEYVDLEARLANAKRMETRLVDLLEQKTTKLADMLAVEKELGRVREDIERFEGTKRYFDSLVSLSTITIYLSEPYKITSSVLDPLKTSLEDAGQLFMTSVASIITVLVVILPWLVILGFVAWFVVFIIRRSKRKKAAKKE